MKKINEMNMTFKAISINEGFARASVAAFCVQANPTLDVLTDIKTAVSEAVTNAVVHAYPKTKGDINIQIILYEEGVEISIRDYGIGIKDIKKAMEPFYTSKPEEERSGMGFTVMESFMDNVTVECNNGLIIKMFKSFENEECKVVNE